MHVYQYVYTSTVFPHYGCQATLTLVLASPYFNFIMSKNLWHLFSVMPNSPTAVYCIIKQHCRWKICPCIVCVPLFKLCSKSGCNYMTSCHGRTCLSFPIHSFSSLSYDRSKASSKTSSPHSAIQSFLFQMREEALDRTFPIHTLISYAYPLL